MVSREGDEQVDVKLTLTMLEQIETYVDDREMIGWYYGNKQQFEKRHDAIKKWLEQELR